MSKLFNALVRPDRTKTQLFYCASYMPARSLTPEAARLVCWRKLTMLYKQQLEEALTEDKTALLFTPAGKTLQEWQIHWTYNNIPTQIEWERKTDKFILAVEYRVLLDGSKIALLSW